MPAYLVTLAAGSAAATKLGGSDAMVVFAGSANDAKAIAKTFYGADGDAKWGGATATEIEAGAEDSVGYWVQIVKGAVLKRFEVSPEAEATLADTADAMQVAMAADEDIGANATIDSADARVLTIAADQDYGDATITAEARIGGIAIPGLAPTVSAPGAEASARTITFPETGVAVVPAVLSALKS